MKTGALKRAIGLAFLYIGIFVLVVLAQFSRGPGFSQKVGGLSVSASYPKANRGRSATAPESLRLSFAGLSFEISPKYPAEGIGPDGGASPLSLSSVEKLPDGVRVKLAPGVEFKATVDRSQGERFALAATAPDGISALRLRLAPSRPARFSVKEGHSLFAGTGASYDLGPSSGALDPAAGILTLKSGDPGFAMARTVQAAPQPVRVAAADRTAAATQAPKDPEAFKAEIAAWRDKAWAGLSSARFDQERIAWKGADGSASFSEKALAAYLAESLARGSYAESFALVRSAKDKWPDRLGYLTAPYFGSLVAKMRDFENADQAENKRFAQSVSDKNPAVLEKEGLMRFILDHAPPAVGQDALRFVSGLDPAKLSPRQAVGLLACAVDAKDLLKDESNPFKDMGPTIDRILACMRKSPAGWFLATEEDGSTDLRTSLLAGGSLVDYGTAAAKPAIVGAGQSLVEGVLGLADPQGFCPARVLAKPDSLAQKTGSSAPEELYPLLTDNPYYPHEVSFARDLGGGLWAWTCSPALTVQASAGRYVFTARFPAGRAHFLTIYGVKPFANIQLYEIDYSPDRDFESYDASGYLYNKDSSALYLKMKHKKESEDIKLSF
jgi:hypothetical protein